MKRGRVIVEKVVCCRDGGGGEGGKGGREKGKPLSRVECHLRFWLDKWVPGKVQEWKEEFFFSVSKRGSRKWKKSKVIERKIPQGEKKSESKT
mmetsp:Transcript_10207/g.15322  ORF Transcript_10207/g.15322 Transcript_10207/m.15322 type:complete len:93 (-) Transcript_10207:260-538(-)